MGSKGKQYGPEGENYSKYGLTAFERRHRKLLPEIWYKNYYGLMGGPNMVKPDPQYVNSKNGHIDGNIVMSRSVWPIGHRVDTWKEAFDYMLASHKLKNYVGELGRTVGAINKKWETNIDAQGPLTWSKRGINKSVSNKPELWMAVGYMSSQGTMTFKNMGMMWSDGTYELGDAAYNQFMGQIVPPPSINQQVINRRVN
jgi:hypothetical protein